MATSMSPTDLRNHVRLHLDVDSTELPDSVLNVYLNEGFDKLIGYFGESPLWLRVEYTFSSAAAQQAYSLDSTSGLIVPTPLQHVRDVRGPNWSLKPADHRQIRQTYRTTSPSTALPTEFSIWQRSIYLWPIPSTAQTLTVTGVRQPIDWITTNSAPDCPPEFHNLIAVWAVQRGYLQQDDLYSAGFMRDEFYAEAANRARRWKSGNDAQPLIVSGSRRPDAWRTEAELGPLIYDWE